MEQFGVFHSYPYQDDKSNRVLVRMRVAPGKYYICESRGAPLPQNLTYGTPLLCEGVLNQDVKYGSLYAYDKCFICSSMTETMPKDVANAIEFIEHMGIHGIASANARHIVDITGPDMEKYFWNNPDPEEFKAKIPSLKIAAAEAFIRRIMTTTTQQKMLQMFASHGATFSDISALYKEIVHNVGHECTIDEVVSTLKPHVMDAQGQIAHGIYYYGAKADIEFDTIDAIGKSLKYRAYHPERLISLMIKCMSNSSQQGHNWSSLSDVYKMCKTLTLTTAFSKTPISQWALYAAAKSCRGLFVVENNGERIYLESSWFDERAIVSQLRRIQGSVQVLPYNETIVNEIEKEFGVTFSDAQRQCFNFLKQTGVYIVTGGAGTGKTTTISGLVSAYTRLNPSAYVALCAPTGRAAQRMTELCSKFGENVKAYTIHKLLDFAPFGEDEARAKYNEETPLMADLIIVDEMSMVDTHLFSALTKAIKNGASVILCGDVNQLASVGAGQVFLDLIKSGKFSTVRLTANYRQASAGSGNNIIVNANRINEGDWNLTVGSDFNIITCRNDQQMSDIIVDLATQNPNATVLSTVREGESGVDALNKKLQAIMNQTKGKQLTIGKTTFRVNDRVLMIRNDYEVGYVNGDIGTIKRIAFEGVYDNNGQKVCEEEFIYVDLCGEEKQISRKNAHDISLAYAMTIHKSQGSEYDSVIIALPSATPSMWQRNLLYTAVTRAKRNVTIVCQADAIEYAVQNTKTLERRTALQELLCKQGD